MIKKFNELDVEDSEIAEKINELIDETDNLRKSHILLQKSHIKLQVAVYGEELKEHEKDCDCCKSTNPDEEAEIVKPIKKHEEEEPKNIIKIPVKDRTEEEHRQIIEWFYSGSVRDYLLSMGKFKDVPLKEEDNWNLGNDSYERTVMIGTHNHRAIIVKDIKTFIQKTKEDGDEKAKTLVDKDEHSLMYNQGMRRGMLFILQRLHERAGDL